MNFARSGDSVTNLHQNLMTAGQQPKPGFSVTYARTGNAQLALSAEALSALGTYDRWSRVSARIKIVLLCIALITSTIVVSRQWRYHSGFEYGRYLDTIGVGACAIIACSLIYIAMAIFDLYEYSSERYVVEPAPRIVEFPTYVDSPASLEELFGEKAWVRKRILRVIMSLGPAVINILGFAVGPFRLPARNPDEPMDFCRIFVAYFEFSLIAGIGYDIILESVGLIFQSKILCWENVRIIRMLGIVSTASFLGLGASLLPRDAQRLLQDGNFESLVMTSMDVFLVVLGMVGVCCKIATVSFVGTKWIGHWSLGDFVVVVFFMNNMMNLKTRSYEDMFDFPGLGLYKFLVRKLADDEKQEVTVMQLECKLRQDWVESYGLLGAMVMEASMTETDAIKLLKYQYRKDVLSESHWQLP